MQLRLLLAFITISAALAQVPAAAQFCVLIYHAHANLGYNEDQFRSHMDFLADNGYHTVTPAEFLDWKVNNAPLPPRPLMITVDDNYIEVYTSMFPILRDRGLKAVNFTITESAGDVYPTMSYCNWNQLREMDGSGVFLCESHTETHPHLTQITSAQETQEIAGSRGDIAANIPGKTSNFIAYPYGDYDATTIQKCVSAGYLGGFAVGSGNLNYHSTPTFEIQRRSGDGKSLEQLKQTIGFYNEPPAPPAGWTADNDSVHWFADDNAWLLQATASGCYGANERMISAGPQQIEARWAMRLPTPSNYRVHAWWRTAGNRAADAAYRIEHADGETTVTADQRASGSQWNLLGTFRFTSEKPAEVFLVQNATGSTCADAIWFEPVTSGVEDWQRY